MQLQPLFTRSWEILTRHWYLIVFGTVIAVFGGGGGGGNAGTQFNSGGSSSGAAPSIESFQQMLSEAWQQIAPYTPLIIAGAIVLFVVGLAFWLLVTFTRGALIGAVHGIESGNDPGFMGAVQMAFGRAGGLIGVALLTALPGFIVGLLILGAALGVVFGFGPNAESFESLLPLFLGVTVLPALLILLPVGIVASVLQHFALRAVMVEERGAVAALGRGWQVLMGNFGSAAVLWLIEVGLQLVIALVLIVPSIIMVCTIVLIPVLFVISGAIVTYFNTLWTLAYRQWAGLPALPTGMVAPMPSAA